MAQQAMISVVASIGWAGQILEAKPKFQSTIVPAIETKKSYRKSRTVEPPR
jgi:hypothetical protein